MKPPSAGLASIVLTAAVLLTGCDSAGPGQDALPGTSGPEFVSMTRDGAPWVPETSGFDMLGLGHASFGWDRNMPGTSYREGVAVLLHDFAGVGDYVLSEGTGKSLASYGVADYGTNTGIQFWTTSAHPGLARISGFDPADSTIAGTFRFDLYFPDGTKTSFAGSFRLRHP